MTELFVVAYAISLVLLVLDWLQTRDIADKPDRFVEKNRFLGKHPSMRRVDVYFAAVAIIYGSAITYFASPPISPELWATVAAVILGQGRVTYQNHRIGIRPLLWWS